MSINPRPNQHDIFNQDSSQSHKRTSLDAPALDLGNIPTPPPTPLTPPAQNQNLAQNAQEPTPQADTTGDNPPPQHTQKEIFANDVSDEPKPYPTSKMRKLSLNAQVINAINAENADEALDFLSTQESNIDWEQVAQARANGVKSHEILSQIASATATNPRAMWINIDTPLSKGELAKAKFDYERSQISNDELKNLKEQTSLNQFKSLNFWLGLDDEKKRQANLTLAKFAESSQSYEDLPQEAKSLLNMQGKDSYTLNVRSIFSGKSEGELLYEQKQKQAKIYKKIKNKEHLSDDELDYIDSYGEGAGFGDNAEKQKQWLLKYEAQNIIPSYAQSMVFALENKADYKALFFGSGKGKESDKEKFLQGLDGIAKVSGFDSASVDEKSGDIFFEKEGFAYQVNTRFLDNIDNMLKANAFSIGGSIAGSIAGAKALGKNPASLIAGIVGGGALGAFVGGTLDGVLADLYTNNQINFAENLRHGLHEGIFNIAGDALVGGAIKGGKVLAKAAKNFTPQGLKDTLASSAQRAKNLTNKIMEYSIVGQAAKNVFDGNASAVRRFLTQIPKEERESIKQGIKDFGLELNLNPKSNQALNNFISKHGQSHPHLANTAQKVYDIFTLPAGKELQQELLGSIRADNTGALLGFLTEAANSSPALQKSLHSILNQTHARAINHLKSFGLKQNDIAQVFEAYQKGTKEAYAKALDMIQEVFKSEKTQVSRKEYDSLVSELKASALDEKELNYLKTLESKIYGNGENGSPRSFENLKDALSLLNEKWGKHAKNMNFTAEKLRRVEKQMREDIKQGINAIFDSSAQGASFRELFESALSDYGNMKGILKAVDKLKLRDTNIAYQKTLDKMLDFLIAGESGDFSNLAKLTAHLPKEQKIKFELATLNALLEKSIFSAKNGQEKVLEVFNSGEFLARLESIAGEFSTPQAREYIDFVKEFHNLFKNDYAISKATLEPALTQKMGGGIATTPTGRFEYQRAKLIYDSIIRLMPHIPFMSNFNEKISGAAVRYHLKSALRKSHSVSELKRTLNVKLASGKFDSPTSKIIAQMLDGVESSQEQIIKELNANTNTNGGSDIGGNPQNPQATHAVNANNPPSSAEGDKGGGYDLAKSKLESATAQPTPPELNQAELESVLAQFDNVENIKKHFLGKPDEKQRYALFSLVQDTLLDPLIKYTSAGKQKYLQKFTSTNESEPFFYMLVTQDKDKTFITHLKTRDMDYLLKDLAQANEIQKGADLIGEFTSWGGSSKATPPTSTNRISGDNAIIQDSSQNLAKNPTKNNQIKQNIFTLAKQEKQAKEQAEIAKRQADSEFIAAREAQKQARLEKLLAAQRDSQGSTTLEARAKIKAEQMGEDIPYTRLSDTHIILDDITYPAEFVMIDKKDLKPSFEAGGFQTREVKQEGKIAQIRDNFDPLKIFGKVGEYDGLPLIARNGEIIAGNHRGEAIKNLSGENLARYNEYAKKVFGIDLPQDKIIVRRILDDTESPQGANLLEQIALAARSNKGAETTLGEQATSALGTYKDKIQKELLDNKARRYIESDSVDNQMQAVANLLNAPLKAEEANLGLLASLSKASHNLDIAKALDMIEGDDLLKAKIKNMLIANAGGFYNISRSIATPKLNEITNYLVDAIAYLGKASKQSGTENINRSEAYRELASKINDRASGKVQSFSTMQTPLDEFVAQTKADVLGASLSKFANQDHASQRLYEALRDMPSILEEKFSTPSFDFFGNGGNKALKEVDMYDFLDYMIGRGQQNEATSQLKDALLELKKLESSNNPPPNPPKNTPPSPNNTPPNKTNPNNPTPSAKPSLDTNAPSLNSTPKAQDPRELRHKELESSLDYRFENKFRKQAEQELGKDLGIDKIDNALMSKTITSREHSRLTKEINEDYAKWFDAQRAKGNKEILAYDKDLAEYRKLHNDIYTDIIKAKRKAENKQAHLQWLDNFKHQMIGKTDEEIIATEIKKPKSTSKGKKEYFTYNEGKHSLKTTRQRLEKGFDLYPLAEFGTNYAEFYQDGKGAIAKLIAEANAAKQAGQDFSGQVAGAFSKEIDGAEASIDLVWGNEKMGLQKITQKHLDDFVNFSGATPQEKLANGLSEIVSKGVVSKTHNGYNIKFNDFVVGLNKGWNEKGVKTGDNKWIVTAFDNSKEISKKATAANFTEGAAQPNNPASEIIAKIQEKMKVSKQYAENLAKWHKDSHPITKEADGTPKVFYHGNKDNDMSFEIFKPYYSPDTSKKAVFFSADKSVAQTYIRKYRLDDENIKKAQVYEVFLQIKNPLVIDFEGEKYAFVSQEKMADKIFKGETYFDLAVDKALAKGNHDGIIFKNIKDNRYGGGDKISDTFVVFDSNQIKAVGNKGTFDGTNPNIYHSSSAAGGGVLGGTIAGVERDEEGNIIGFSPEKFALGFAGGAVGGFALKRAMQNPKIKAKLEKFATMQRVKARKNNKMHYEILNKINKSPNFGSKMDIIGKDNLNAEVLNYIIATNKRIAINKLDEKTAKMLDFHYPHDVRRTIQPDEIIHTLQRHGTDSNLVKFSGQKPVTIDDIAKYQDYADSADIKRTSQDKTRHNVLVSLKQLDDDFIVVVEQVKKMRNELGFKTMYFEKGRLDEETIERLTSIARKNA